MDAALTFGASSSPGIFDRVAELVLTLALHLAGLARDLALRQLDDNVFIGHLVEVTEAYEVYHRLALDIGVSFLKKKGEISESVMSFSDFEFHLPDSHSSQPSKTQLLSNFSCSSRG